MGRLLIRLKGWLMGSALGEKEPPCKENVYWMAAGRRQSFRQALEEDKPRFAA